MDKEDIVTYEQALLVGITECLKLLENGKDCRTRESC